MRLVQISDLHFTRPSWNPLRFCPKRIAGMLNWFFFRKTGCEHQPLLSLPDLFKKLQVDLVLVGGDLTSTSLFSEFEAAKEFFDSIKLPKIFIPGNHDQYTRGSHREKRFYRYFQNKRKTIEHPAEFFTLCDHGIEVHPIQPGWWCVALDTAEPTSLASSNGFFSIQVEKYLEEVLQSLPPQERIIMLNHFPFFENDPSLHRLIRAEHLRAIIERHPNIFLYLHGHTHRHTIADLRSNRLPVIFDSGCPIQKPHGTWNLIDLTHESCQVDAFHWNGQAWESFKKAIFDWSR